MLIIARSQRFKETIVKAKVEQLVSKRFLKTEAERFKQAQLAKKAIPLVLPIEYFPDATLMAN